MVDSVVASANPFFLMDRETALLKQLAYCPATFTTAAGKRKQTLGP
jgi:hypothetical protein